MNIVFSVIGFVALIIFTKKEDHLFIGIAAGAFVVVILNSLANLTGA